MVRRRLVRNFITFRRHLRLPLLMCTILKTAAVDWHDTDTNLYQTQTSTINVTIIFLPLTQNKHVASPLRGWQRSDSFPPPQRNPIHLLPMGSGGSLSEYSSSNMNLTIYLRLMEMVTNETESSLRSMKKGFSTTSMSKWSSCSTTVNWCEGLKEKPFELK